MLKLFIPSGEFWDENAQQFVTTNGCVLHLEHSLLSISKWESTWKKPFLSEEPRTRDELIDYIRCMTINPRVDPLVYASLTKEHTDLVNTYINDPMTASTVDAKKTGARRGSKITSELIYYWMVSYRIPFECQKWHLNRLLMLIQICNAKNQPDKKIPKKEAALHNSRLNAARRAKMRSRG